MKKLLSLLMVIGMLFCAAVSAHAEEPNLELSFASNYFGTPGIKIVCKNDEITINNILINRRYESVNIFSIFKDFNGRFYKRYDKNLQFMDRKSDKISDVSGFGVPFGESVIISMAEYDEHKDEKYYAKLNPIKLSFGEDLWFMKPTENILEIKIETNLGTVAYGTK